MGRMQQHGKRRALTLLEVLLSMGLLVVLSSMTYWFYSSSLDIRREGLVASRRLRLVRVVLDRMGREIRQAVTMTKEGVPGLRGEAERIWITTLRVPSREIARERSVHDLAPPAEFDLTKVEYKIARHPEILHPDGYELPLGIARVEIPVPRPDSYQTGEGRENDRMVVGGEEGAAEAEAALLDEQLLREADAQGIDFSTEVHWEELYAPELKYLRFCYYDGNRWWDDWDIKGENPLPQMVMVTVGFEPLPPFDDEFLDRDLEEFCTCMNQDPVDCLPLPPDQYSMIVRVTQSDPLFRSRITRETQDFLQRAGNEQEAEGEVQP